MIGRADLERERGVVGRKGTDRRIDARHARAPRLEALPVAGVGGAGSRGEGVADLPGAGGAGALELGERIAIGSAVARSAQDRPALPSQRNSPRRERSETA